MEKFTALTITGAVGGGVISVFGGWSPAMTALIIFMLCDYVTGLLTAGVFKKSNKTADGGLESKAGWKGLTRKFGTLIIVLIAAQIDILLHTDYIKNAVCMALLTNEAISILENVGLMGVPIPEPIKNAITALKEKGENK